MGVYDFLSGDGTGGGDVAEGERFQRSEQQERILPQHEQHAHPIVQVRASLGPMAVLVVGRQHQDLLFCKV